MGPLQLLFHLDGLCVHNDMLGIYYLCCFILRVDLSIHEMDAYRDVSVATHSSSDS